MKAWEQKLVPAGFALAGVLFLFAAFRPTLNDQELNAAFLIIGIVFVVLGVVFMRKSGGTAGPPPG